VSLDEEIFIGSRGRAFEYEAYYEGSLKSRWAGI